MTAQDPSFATGSWGRLLSFLRTALHSGQPVQRRSSTKAAMRRPGFVSLVGAGPGSADLVTLRGLDRIRRADAIFYDRLADPALLSHARRGAMLTYVGKAPGCHAMPQQRINALMVDAAQRGLRVVRLKCGDPGIFGRGAEEAAALDAAGVPWDIVPGVTSASAAAASARSFLTERGQTERVILITGHSRDGGTAPDWAASARPGTTLVCYMGVASAAVVQKGLLSGGWPAGSSVEIVSNSQTPQQIILHCALRGLASLVRDHAVRSPSIITVRWPSSLSVTGQTAAEAREQANATA